LEHSKTEKILQAALEVFAAQGFERATVDEIALRAQVAKGTVFYHYKSKEDLFIQLIRSGIGLLIDTVRSEVQSLVCPTDKLKAIIKVQTELSFAHTEFFSILQSEVWGKLERQQVLRQALAEYLSLISTIVMEGITCGEFAGTDADSLAATIFGMSSVTVLYLLISQHSNKPEEVIDDLQRCLLQGILIR
jgi:TetR/AcrR family transcriptional regulator